jgi:hypothetical protein
MGFDCDYRAEATTAMEMAAAATDEAERLKWLRVALAWRDLEHDAEQSKRVGLMAPISLQAAFPP